MVDPKKRKKPSTGWWSAAPKDYKKVCWYLHVGLLERFKTLAAEENKTITEAFNDAIKVWCGNDQDS